MVVVVVVVGAGLCLLWATTGLRVDGMDEWTGGWVEQCTDGRMNGEWLDGWLESGWIEAWMVQ